MVATQAITTAILAVGGHQMVPRFQIPGVDPKTDAAIKALAGVALIVASAVLVKKDGWGKTILIGAGVGLALGAGIPLVKSMR